MGLDLSRETAADEPAVDVDLTDPQRALLTAGLLEWSGPARATDALALALALGFADAADMTTRVQLLAGAVRRREALPVRDWRRALLALEVAFVDDVFGSGPDWPTTTGLSDDVTIALLRSLQRTLPRD